jgi:hypothetical protein
MDFFISSYESVGSIKFGMTQAEIQNILGGGGKNIDDLEKWDIFHDIGIQVSYGYNQPYVCRAVMLYEPARPIFQTRNLLDGTSIEKLQDWFALEDPLIEVESDGIITYKFGIYLSTQSYRLFKYEPPESVVVFEKGYYDDLSSSAEMYGSFFLGRQSLLE